MNNDWTTRATREAAENFGKTMETGAENMWAPREGLIPGAENVREMPSTAGSEKVHPPRFHPSSNPVSFLASMRVGVNFGKFCAQQKNLS